MIKYAEISLSLSLSIALALTLWMMERGPSEAVTLHPYISGVRTVSNSSSSSKYPYTNTIHSAIFWVKHGPVVTTCCTQRYHKYYLNDIYNHLLGSTFMPECGNHVQSAECCQKILESIVRECDNHNIKIEVQCEIPRLSSSGIGDVFFSKHQAPDLYMHLGNDITAETIVKIYSSYYEDTLRKALITATDLLRLRRMYSDTHSIIAFCFPS